MRIRHPPGLSHHASESKVDAQNTLYFIKVKQNSCCKARFSLKNEGLAPSMEHMKRIVQIAGCLALLLSPSCQQFSQQAVRPIPPPAPETLCQPIHPALKDYYTLPHPL